MELEGPGNDTGQGLFVFGFWGVGWSGLDTPLEEFRFLEGLP